MIFSDAVFNRSGPTSQQTEQQQSDTIVLEENPARMLLQDSLQKLFGN